MAEELAPRYDHKSVEEKIYPIWEKSGYFNPDNLPPAKNAKPFTIIMPPPNANGPLHVGHAFEVALQDLMVRFWRMRGRRTLWLPGADHAGFETQVVFDKKLEKEGRNRFQIDREVLYKEMWEFTQANKKTMEGQLRRLGASCDWSREKFTLDPEIIKTVYDTFKKLHNDNLLYRDIRVVNWCAKHKTALSDLEVKYVERSDPLYYIKYGPLTLATVRPETKFGDTALAVNPKDKRYQKYIGKIVEAQGLLGPLKFKVVADEAVDPVFGTGVVKVTPAHDATDFEIWQRHKNEISGPKIIIDENGRLTGETGQFHGLKVAEARQKVAEEMQRIGILEKVDPNYVHQVATCYKCGTTLEPLPKLQWFVKMKSLAKAAIRVAKNKKIVFVPKRFEKVYLHWLQNIRDWNISRQIVWGIRIPAWYCLFCGDVKINPQIKSRWFLVRHGETDWNKEERALGQADIPLNAEGLRQIKIAADQFRDKKIDLIISSDLSRCRATAEAIREITNAEIIIDKEMRERFEGETEGMLIKDRDAIHGATFESYEGKVAGGESFKDLEERVLRAFAKHSKAHRHRNIVIVSHAGPIKAILKNLKNLDFSKARSRRLKNAEVISLDISNPCKKCGGDFYEQDPDVFDTWFSSGQWPFATLGFPNGKDFETFYPTDVMAPGYEIIFFWVARMVMLGLYRTGKIPFKTVYIHGMVRDKDRQKMSKSKGNVTNPLGVAETYGTDAMRMALVVGCAPGNDPVTSEDKIRGYRNFATKLWNVARFILMNKPQGKSAGISFSAEDKKNLAELKKIKSQITKHLENFEFHLSAEKLYHYIWHEFADKIIETYKPRLKNQESARSLEEDLGGAASLASKGFAAPRASGRSPQERANRVSERERADSLAAYQTLETILIECLKMLHPLMPFVTEEIYQKFRPGKMLMIEKW